MSSARPPRVQKPSADLRIVLIDQSPLRESAGKEARKKMGEVHKLSIKLEEFNRTIRPAYERWESEHLGPLVDEERHLSAKISHLEHFISQASLEALFTGRDPYTIYEEWVDANPEWNEGQSKNAEGSDAGPGHGEDAGNPRTHAREEEEAARFSEEEQAFRSYMRFACGEDPDSLGKRQYQRLFNEYRRWREKLGGGCSSKTKSKDIPARIKEIYRILVRRLHPDTGKAAPDPQLERLWHDLQEAYVAMDLERMEVLLAITDLHESGDAMRSTLYHLRKVARKMAVTARELKARYREARESEAWMFWHAVDRKKFGAKIRADIETRIDHSKKHIAALEEKIEVWKKKSEAPKQPKRSPATNPPKPTKPKPTKPKTTKSKTTTTKKSPPVFGQAVDENRGGVQAKQQHSSSRQTSFDF